MAEHENRLNNDTYLKSSKHSGNLVEEIRSHNLHFSRSEIRRLHRVKIDQFLVGLGVVVALTTYGLFRLEVEQAYLSLPGIAGLAFISISGVLALGAVGMFISAMDKSCKLLDGSYHQASPAEHAKQVTKEKRSSAWGRRLIGLSVGLTSIGIAMFANARMYHILDIHQKQRATDHQAR